MRPLGTLLAVLSLAACSSNPVAISDAGPITLGSECNPNAVIDLCLAKGYVCAIGDGGLATCGYAEANDPCLSSVGCDPKVSDLGCFEFSASQDGGAPSSFCGTPCVHPTDCLDSTADCYASPLPDGGLRGACLTNFCDTASGPCSVAPDSSDGTCFPDGKFGDNVCHQSGPVATDSPCSGSTFDGGAYLCQQFEFCGTGADGGDSACLAICGNGRTCPGTQACVNDYQVCMTPCSDTNRTCPSPFTCLGLISGVGTSLGYYCWLP